MDNKENNKILEGKVNIIGSPVFTYRQYVVYIGTVSEQDFPHYLIINNDTGVIEESTNNLAMARDMAVAFAEKVKSQDEAIAKGDLPNGKMSDGAKNVWTN